MVTAPPVVASPTEAVPSQTVSGEATPISEPVISSPSEQSVPLIVPDAGVSTQTTDMTNTGTTNVSQASPISEPPVQVIESSTLPASTTELPVDTSAPVAPAPEASSQVDPTITEVSVLAPPPITIVQDSLSGTVQ